MAVRGLGHALAALLLAAAMLAGCCAQARADGDPASDFLLSQQVFVLLQSSATPPAQRQLTEVVASSNKAGYPIRVAVISSEYDLGSVSVLWKRPRTYAQFLGIELSLAYKGPLLVVMPNGFGFNWPGHSTAAAYGLLAKVKVPPGELGTLTAAQAAVRRLASAAGVHLSAGSAAAAATAPVSHEKSSSSGGAGIAILIAAVVALALALALALGLLLRRRTRTTAGRLPSWALPRVAALFALAVAVPILAVGLLRHGSSAPPKTAAHAVTQETPFTWSEGQRQAPDFTLTDQNGRSISPAAYRGRPVIVTFIDPLCRNLCPLEAKVLNEVDERLPVAQRPQIIAVSVDIYADTHADLMQDFGRWSLVPQWHWAVGSPSQLQAVWKHYYAEVEVQTKHIAGTTVHYITHSEMAYLLDGKGYERALFSWPFSAKAVRKTLAQLERS
jgi:cytochrome oxidase Cu insertion factor (SCO1/SenC/PrrC family)